MNIKFTSVICQNLGLSRIKIWIHFYLETLLILTRDTSQVENDLDFDT